MLTLRESMPPFGFNMKNRSALALHVARVVAFWENGYNPRKFAKFR